MSQRLKWGATLLATVAAVLVLTSVAPRNPPGGFGLGDLRGRYSFFLTGEVTGGPVVGPFDVIGVIEADGHGNLPFATRTINVAGQLIVQNDTASGTYSINPDGTGSATFYPDVGGGPVTFDVVLTNKREFLAVATDVGVTGYGAGTRQN